MGDENTNEKGEFVSNKTSTGQKLQSFKNAIKAHSVSISGVRMAAKDSYLEVPFVLLRSAVLKLAMRSSTMFAGFS